MPFSLGLCVPNLYLKLTSVPERESKACSGAQEPSFLAELGPQGGASEKPAHMVRCSSVPVTLHVRVLPMGAETMCAGIYEISSILSVHVTFFPSH